MSSLLMLLSIACVALVGNVLCAEVDNRYNHQNVWQRRQLNVTNSDNINTRQFGKNSATTPWPALGGQRYQFHNNPSTTRAPLWVRPNNGTNWVRNTPSPQQNINNYHNTRPQTNTRNFLNNERHGTHSNAYPTNRGGSVNGAFSSGSLLSDTRDSFTSNQRDKSNQKIDVSDEDLRQFSEELLYRENNSPAQYVSANFQGKTSSRSTADEAPLPLLSVNSALYSMPTISKLTPLYNNYIVETNQNEVYTQEEKNEENDFLNAVLSTPVMEYTRNFLINKGKIGRNPQEFKDILRQIWFDMYSRGGGKVGSSGFEHVFLGELKKGQVSGLHNWVYFAEEEKKNQVNYLGYMKKIDLGGKGFLISHHFTFHGNDKPVNTMFIGTSPEFEMALYSTCFLIRPDAICPLKLNGSRFIIRTYTFRYRGKNLIGSAFANI